jgi:hypothetical protein
VISKTISNDKEASIKVGRGACLGEFLIESNTPEDIIRNLGGNLNKPQTSCNGIRLKGLSWGVIVV